MSLLSDTFYLGRAGRYSDPLNSNDLLPVVYGDHTDGTEGNWRLPCIDTVTFVYAFADHAVLTVAGGNSINIYADDALVNPADYTFSASNDYDGLGTISTVTFSASQSNSAISARGKGKVLTGTTLMENIIDIINDFLTVENSFASSLFEATAKASSRAIFVAQSYKAAGVITQDLPIWQVITDMMGSFFGSAYVSGEGKLVLDIDINTVALSYAGVISKRRSYLTDAKIKLENIINQCPCDYAYNYVKQEFSKQTDESYQADIASQGIFGVRKPNTPYQFYWCRDLTSVQLIQDLIVTKLKKPLYEIEITTTALRHVDVDIGDFIVYSAERLFDEFETPMYNHVWKVIGVKPEYSKNRIIFYALQTNLYLYFAYLADGTYTAGGSIKAGDNRDLTVY